MYRKISEKLAKWKNENKRKPLIIIGARQVGKTYSVREFAEANYEKTIEINFQDEVKARTFFEESRSADDIISYLEINNIDVSLDENTLVFFDEIQLCPELITSLKFLGEKLKSDIICSGSMLGIRINGMSSFPVGYVGMINMYPMSFDEFLKAKRLQQKFIDEARCAVAKREEVPQVVHEKLNELFTEYIICGGMPEAVSNYIENGIKAAVKVNRRLFGDYELDIAHYADSKTRLKALDCFKSIPLQLAKENKKFQYKLVREGYNARHFDESLAWLYNAGLIYQINRLKRIESPIEINKELGIFKVYLFDTGLLVSSFQDGIVSEILNNTLGVYKGVVYENVTATLLRANGINAFYYEPTTSAEIDFVIENNQEIIPIEVKGGLHTKSTSFNNFIKNHDCKKAFRFSKKNVGISDDGIVSYLPYYALEWIIEDELIKAD